MAHRPTILLTGFGPFPGIAENASALLIPELAAAARRRFPDHRVHAEVLATEWRRGPARAAMLVSDLKPVLALHFGISGKAVGFTLEARAHNLARPLPDADGQWPTASALAPAAGPEFIPASLPVALAVDRLRRLQLPAVLSRNAGGYLCNAVFYASLQCADRCAAAVKVGFVHLPSRLAPQSLRGSWGCPLTWEQAMTGSLEIMAVGVGQAAQPSRLVRPSVHSETVLVRRRRHHTVAQRSNAAMYS